MAKIAVISIFFFFVLSSARTPFNLPAHESESSSVSESETREPDLATIQLPSERSESHAAPAEDLPESDTITAIGVTQPVRVRYDVNFRPINRHFHHMHANRPFWFRLPHGRCRHHGNGKPTTREISYGNDMIMSDETYSVSHPMFRGDAGKMPARFGRFHGERAKFAVKSLEVNAGLLTEEDFKIWTHVAGPGGDDQQEEEKQQHEKHGYGFVKKFRKFLSHRF